MSTDPLAYVLASLRRAADNAYPWLLTPTEAGAFVAEVERLRAERHLDNEALARAWDESRDMERAAVVAWLREMDIECGDDHAIARVARLIERGEHCHKVNA